MNRSRNRRSSQVVLITLLIAGLCYVGLSSSAEPPPEKKDTQAAGKQKTDQDDKKKTGNPKKKVNPLSRFMRGKLDASNSVLEGMLTEDFKLIEDGGNRLKEISDAEKWRISNDMMYRHHSEDFRNNVDKLIKAAKKGESLDRVALIWFDTTLSCIDCHHWVRTMIIAEGQGEIDAIPDLLPLRRNNEAPKTHVRKQ